eukprot:s3107_g17.t1
MRTEVKNGTQVARGRAARAEQRQAGRAMAQQPFGAGLVVVRREWEQQLLAQHAAGLKAGLEAAAMVGDPRTTVLRSDSTAPAPPPASAADSASRSRADPVMSHREQRRLDALEPKRPRVHQCIFCATMMCWEGVCRECQNNTYIQCAKCKTSKGKSMRHRVSAYSHVELQKRSPRCRRWERRTPPCRRQCKECGKQKSRTQIRAAGGGSGEPPHAGGSARSAENRRAARKFDTGIQHRTRVCAAFASRRRRNRPRSAAKRFGETGCIGSEGHGVKTVLFLRVKAAVAARALGTNRTMRKGKRSGFARLARQQHV